MARKYVEPEDETRRTGAVSGTLIVIAPTPGPKTFQGPGDMAPPFEGGGRQADLPAAYNQRAAADADYAHSMAHNQKRALQLVGIPRSRDGTPWLKSNKER